MSGLGKDFLGNLEMQRRFFLFEEHFAYVDDLDPSKTSMKSLFKEEQFSAINHLPQKAFVPGILKDGNGCTTWVGLAANMDPYSALL